jgi:hypothetical protein
MKPKKSNHSNKHGKEFDLGLAVLRATRPPGYVASLDEIAAYCGVRKQSIWMVEFAILKKLKRKAVRFNDPLFKELAAQAGIKGAQ